MNRSVALLPLLVNAAGLRLIRRNPVAAILDVAVRVVEASLDSYYSVTNPNVDFGASIEPRVLDMVDGKHFRDIAGTTFSRKSRKRMLDKTRT
jgi:hypothetical protein